MDQATILIADDDRLVRTTLVRAAQNAGFHTLEASNGEEAVLIGCLEKPNLAVLDIRMPLMDGIEAARQLRERVSVPSMFVTAYDDSDLVDRAIFEGGYGYLLKPLNISAILPSIALALVRAEDTSALQHLTDELKEALRHQGETNIATGILMERHSITADQAWNLLRGTAQVERYNLVEYAQKIVTAANLKNDIIPSDLSIDPQPH